MSNIKKVFEKGKAFIAFITCGDPDLETTARLSGLPQRMVQISSNLAYRSLILPQKVPSFRVQI